MAPLHGQDRANVRPDSSVLVAMTALVGFDYFQTLHSEIQHVWKAKKSAVFFLFLSLRYATIFAQISNCMTSVLPFTQLMACPSLNMATLVLSLIRDWSLSAIFLLRCFAIWNRDRKVLLFLGFICVAQMAMNGFSQIYYIISLDLLSHTGCGGLFLTSTITAPPLLTEIFLCLTLIFDTLVVVLTVVKTLQLSSRAKELRSNRSLSFYILRDGVLYFALVDAMIIAVIVAEALVLQNWPLVTVAPEVKDAADVLFSIFQTLGSILLQRFILNLRKVVKARQCEPTMRTTPLKRLDFAHGSVIGNIGAPLNVDGDNGTIIMASGDAESVIQTQPEGYYEGEDIVIEGRESIDTFYKGQFGKD